VKTKITECPFCGRKSSFYIIQEGSRWNSGMGCKCGVEVYFFKNGVNVSHGAGSTLAEQKEILARWNHRAKIKGSDRTAPNTRMKQ